MLQLALKNIKKIQRAQTAIIKMHFGKEQEDIKRKKEKEIADILKIQLQATYVYIQDTTVGGSCK